MCFLIHIAVQVAYYSDNLVVGAFLSPAAVTVYAIGGMLIAYARNIITLDDFDLHAAGQQL